MHQTTTNLYHCFCFVYLLLSSLSLLLLFLWLVRILSEVPVYHHWNLNDIMTCFYSFSACLVILMLGQLFHSFYFGERDITALLRALSTFSPSPLLCPRQCSWCYHVIVRLKFGSLSMARHMLYWFSYLWAPSTFYFKEGWRKDHLGWYLLILALQVYQL